MTMIDTTGTDTPNASSDCIYEGCAGPAVSYLEVGARRTGGAGGAGYWATGQAGICSVHETITSSGEFEIVFKNSTLSDPDVNTPGLVHHNTKDETARLAALRVQPKTGTQRRRVLDTIAIRYPNGLTDEESSDMLGMKLSSVQARRGELEDGNWVKASSMRRDTKLGNPSIVWVLTPQGKRALDYNLPRTLLD